MVFLLVLFIIIIIIIISSSSSSSSSNSRSSSSSWEGVLVFEGVVSVKMEFCTTASVNPQNFTDVPWIRKKKPKPEKKEKKKKKVKKTKKESDDDDSELEYDKDVNKILEVLKKKETLINNNKGLYACSFTMVYFVCSRSCACVSHMMLLLLIIFVINVQHFNILKMLMIEIIL